MKTTRTLSLMICLLMAVGTVQAQENIKRAIDEFLDDTRVNYTESHHKNRNPETGEMEGRLDAYTFTLAPKDLKLLDMLKEAVKKDSEDAYEENWESSSSPEAVYRQRKVMYNDNEGLVIGYEYYNYIQVNFVDKSKDGFRYAYIIEWEKVDMVVAVRDDSCPCVSMVDWTTSPPHRNPWTFVAMHCRLMSLEIGYGCRRVGHTKRSQLRHCTVKHVIMVGVFVGINIYVQSGVSSKDRFIVSVKLRG